MNRRSFLGALFAAPLAAKAALAAPVARVAVNLAVAPVEVSGYFSIADILRKAYPHDTFAEAENTFVPFQDEYAEYIAQMARDAPRIVERYSAMHEEGYDLTIGGIVEHIADWIRYRYWLAKRWAFPPPPFVPEPWEITEWPTPFMRLIDGHPLPNVNDDHPYSRTPRFAVWGAVIVPYDEYIAQINGTWDKKIAGNRPRFRDAPHSR